MLSYGKRTVLCMDENKAGSPALSEQLSGPRLPSWEELPDLELYMDQVLSLAERWLGAEGRGLTASMVNNYVKLGVVPPPVRKRYSRAHLATLLMVCLLKPVLPIASVQALLSAALAEDPLETVYARFRTEHEEAGERALEAARALQEPGADGVQRAALLAGAEQSMALRLLALLRSGER